MSNLLDLDLNKLNIEKDDETILKSSVKNPKMFELLVDRYQEAFLRKLRVMRINDEDASDIVQDAFVKIYTNAHKFEKVEGASFKSWGYKILINTALTALKKLKRDKDAMAYLEPEEFENLAPSDSGFSRLLGLDEFMSIASKIPVAFNRVLSKVFIEGKSASDIAKEENTSVEAIRTRLHRAKKEYRKISTMMC